MVSECLPLALTGLENKEKYLTINQYTTRILMSVPFIIAYKGGGVYYVWYDNIHLYQ